MQLANGCQGFAEHRLLGIAQRRLGLHRTPGVTEALRRVEVVEQQPAALALLQPVGQQRRVVSPWAASRRAPSSSRWKCRAALPPTSSLASTLRPRHSPAPT